MFQNSSFNSSSTLESAHDQYIWHICNKFWTFSNIIHCYTLSIHNCGILKFFSRNVVSAFNKTFVSTVFKPVSNSFSYYYPDLSRVMIYTNPIFF